MIALSPRDTNNYVRGWQFAVNKAGVGPVPVDRTKPSKYTVSQQKSLQKQVRFTQYQLFRITKRRDEWAKLTQARYDAIGRSDKWEREAKAELRRRNKQVEYAKAVYEQAITEREQGRAAVNAGTGSVVIWGRNVKTNKKLDTSGPVPEKLIQRQNLVRVVRVPVPGTGSVRATGSGAVCTLHNMLGHASIVESRNKVFAKTRAAVKTRGIAAVRTRVGKAVRGAAA